MQNRKRFSLPLPSRRPAQPGDVYKRQGYDLLVTMKGTSFQQIALFVAMRLSPLDDVLSTATSFVLRPYKRGGILFQDEEIDERECTVL